MNGINLQSLFFVSLPDLRKLCGVKVSLLCDPSDGDARNKQMKMCRELLFLYPDLLVSPVPGTCSEITVIMAITFFKSGSIQAYTQRHEAKMDSPQRVLPGMLQTCLSYTLIAKLAPNWNKAGHLLIQVMELNVTEAQLCISLEAYTIRLPPAKLEDFDISMGIVKNFFNNRNAVIQKYSIPSNWCYILPSMKMGQIISVSHTISLDCPFQSYEDIQNHWNSLYGYRLPHINEEDVVYCSVYFKLIGERLFTYPFCCIRSLPVQHFPRVNLEEVLSLFVSELKAKLQHLCGLPVKMTSKPCYSTSNLTNPHSEGSCSRPANLTTKANYRPALTQLPTNIHQSCSEGTALGLPFSQQRVYCSSQLTMLSAEKYSERSTFATEIQRNSTPINGHFTQPSNSSTPLQARSESKIIPIFKNNILQLNVNVTKILAEKRQQSFAAASLISGNNVGVMEKPGTSYLQRPVPSVTNTKSALAQQQPTTKYSGNPTSHPSFTSNGNALFKGKPGMLRPQFSTNKALTPGLQKFGCDGKSTDVFTQNRSNQIGTVLAKNKGSGPLVTQPEKKNETVKRKPQESGLESKPKKPRAKAAVQDVDVEEYARNNQLLKVNSVTLQAWLKMRGISVKAKDKKEELVSKIMQCISEP
ncbi:uncharacterized protein C18orf63-like [Polyodon spathula]|uniref:uncharacterized protein C18orf63-like n=1 Tax=Polyodon spathula TaxID=7913 RepID=UPI001B7E7928|nr:uncharacterized protein C18orf63-like [Polyodon spathula]